MPHLRSFLTIALLSCTASLFAQQFTVTESATPLKGAQHMLLNCPNGDHITLTYPFPDKTDPVIFSRWESKTLKQQQTSTLQELTRQNLRAALYSDQRLFLFCSNKDGAVSRYELDDKNGTLNGPSIGIYNLQAKEDGAYFYSGSSPNNVYHYLIMEEKPKKEDGKSLGGIIFNRQMNKVAAFSYITPEHIEGWRTLRPAITLNDDGVLSVIYGAEVKTSKEDYTPFQYTLIQTNTEGKTTTQILTGMPSGLLANLSCRANNGATRRNAFILKLAKDGKPMWLNVVSKEQLEANQDIRLGIACMVSDNSYIHVFFNDNPKNADPVSESPKGYMDSNFKSGEFACVSIAPDGSMKKQFIPIPDNTNWLWPAKATSPRHNELLYVRMKPKFSPGSLENAFNTNYNYGTITVR